MTTFYVCFGVWCLLWIGLAVFRDHPPEKQFHWGAVCGVHAILGLLIFAKLIQTCVF